jgi:predicted metalloendopeptidase
MTLNLQWQDSGVRPQDDFYRHWLGKWLETYEIPEDKAEFASFTELHDTAQEQLKAIIERLSSQSPQPDSNAGRIGILFNAFMDLDAITAAGLEPISDLFAKVDALTSVAELPGLFGHLEREGVGSPLGGAVHQDNRDSTRYVLDMWQSGLGLPDRDYYLEDNFARVRTAYLEHVGSMLQRCGVGRCRRCGADRRPGDTPGTTALDTGRQPGPGEDLQPVPARRAVRSHARVRLGLLPAQRRCARPHRDTQHRPARLRAGIRGSAHEIALDDWKPYLRWRILSSFTSLLSEDTVQASFDFYGKVLRGVPQMRPRWKRGVDLVEGMVGEALGQEYVAEHFPPENKVRMLELVDNLLQAFEQSIDGLDWMTDQTKQQAHAKLAMFTAKIGYPDVWKDYSDMRLVPGELIASVRAARQWHHDYEVNKLGGPVDRHEWHMNPQTVNAYYNPEMNEIVFPAAILQPPFFTMAADDAVNYGAIGAVIGHEISHGFDDQGCQFDGPGICATGGRTPTTRRSRTGPGSLSSSTRSTNLWTGTGSTGS